MSRFLSVGSGGSSVAIAVCPRCTFKVHYSKLVKDPNTKQFVCKKCKDIYDPWKLPARHSDKITLTHPRPDSKLNTLDVEAHEDILIGAGTNLPLEYDNNVELGI